MPGRDTAARRYAEAAFEVALRDDSVAAWREALETPAAIAADEQVGHMLANPAVALETRARHGRTRSSARSRCDRSSTSSG